MREEEKINERDRTSLMSLVSEMRAAVTFLIIFISLSQL